MIYQITWTEPDKIIVRFAFSRDERRKVVGDFMASKTATNLWIANYNRGEPANYGRADLKISEAFKEK